jgi:16S rRNA G966 N2-methylase RsmD
MTEVTLGSCRLILGDCREVLPALRSESVDFIFTDPPYGNNNQAGDLQSALGKLRGAGGPNGSEAGNRPIANDDAASANALVRYLFGEAGRLLPPGGCCAVCCAGGGGELIQFAHWSLWLAEAIGFKQMVIWDKGPMGLGWHYRRSYEVVLVGEKGGAACRWFDESDTVENVIRPGDYGVAKIIPAAGEHPTAKSPALAGLFIRLHTAADHLVLDPFMGGGSTALAALRSGRRFIGIELDPQWFELTCRRLEEVLAQGDLFADASPHRKAQQLTLAEQDPGDGPRPGLPPLPEAWWRRPPAQLRLDWRRAGSSAPPPPSAPWAGPRQRGLF